MRPNLNLLPYLKGEAFSNSLAVTWEYEPEDKRYSTRVDTLLNLVRGRKIIHIGCVDHNIEMIDGKSRRQKWLHKALAENTEKCYGIDINREGIEYLRNDLGYIDVECLNILQDDHPTLFSETWDFILLPEVLEHQGNPVDFLKALRGRFENKGQRLVITVPNALDEGNFRNARKGIEIINTDHRHWYTPYTLTKIVVDSGFVPERMLSCKNGSIKPWSFFKNRHLRHHPMLRNNLVLIAAWPPAENPHANVAIPR